jgi:hypothetical protein
MSDEVIGAIKFQHHNLLHLVDHLRDRIVHMTRTVQQTRDAAEKEKAYHPQTPIAPLVDIVFVDFGDSWKTGSGIGDDDEGVDEEVGG